MTPFIPLPSVSFNDFVFQMSSFPIHKWTDITKNSSNDLSCNNYWLPDRDWNYIKLKLYIPGQSAGAVEYTEYSADG